MVLKIEVKAKYADTRAEVIQKNLNSHLGEGKVSRVSLSDCYTIEKDLSVDEIASVASMLTNPVSQEAIYYPSDSQKTFSDLNFNWALEVGFLPGVTDNVASTTKEGIADLVGKNFETGEGVYTSRTYFLSGDLSRKDLEVISGVLANPVIQRVHIKSSYDFSAAGGMDVVVPKVKIAEEPGVISVDLDVSDEGLTLIGKEGILGPDGKRRGPLALDLDYMKTIQAYFKNLGRQPTDIELESIAQTWSEHCKHTIFADPMDEIAEGIYKACIKSATQKIRASKQKDLCVSVFTDNAGAFEFDDDYLVTHKVETHNSPSALDPFGGAITGIVGVNRDAMGFGMGAKPIANTYGFCFADPHDKTPLYRDKDGKSPMLDPEKIASGVIAGVNSGGNESGIPTPQGFMYFHKRFKGKPLVFVGTVGLIPKKLPNGELSHVKQAQPGDHIVMLGGRVGLDGIHGATFSSTVLDSGSPATAVQIGDPITQKKMSDALIKEARNKGLYNSITDNGAGGLSCSVAEMAKESGGFELQIEKVPLKYPGLDPWQTWISESQERMTLAVPPAKWDEFKALMDSRGVEASVLGTFTDNGRCLVTFSGKRIMDMDMQFLHDGLPEKHLKTTYTPVEYQEPELPSTPDATQILHDMMGRLNLASTAFVTSQYDHEVQGTSVLKPLQGSGMVNADISVIRPRLDSDRGVAISQGLTPSYTEIDPYAMAASSIDTAIRNLVATGADLETISILDNFCWCSSNDPERLGQLKLAAQACHDVAVAYGTPFISGKDSMFNDFRGFDENLNPVIISALPTLLVSSIGIVPDVYKSVSIDAKSAGDLIYLLGETHDELGGSEFYAYLSRDNDEYLGSRVPKVQAETNNHLYRGYYDLVQNGLVASAVSVGRGGLGTALAKKIMAGGLGANISLANLAGSFTADYAGLFSESQGRILVSINPKCKNEFEEKAAKLGALSFLGEVTDEPELSVQGKHGLKIKANVKDLLKSYRSTFEGF